MNGTAACLRLMLWTAPSRCRSRRRIPRPSLVAFPLQSAANQSVTSLMDSDTPAKEAPKVTINRAAPDIRSDDIDASRSFYAGLLGFNVAMEKSMRGCCDFSRDGVIGANRCARRN